MPDCIVCGKHRTKPGKTWTFLYLCRRQDKGGKVSEFEAYTCSKRCHKVYEGRDPAPDFGTSE